MKMDRIVGMLIRATMDTLMRHLPGWLARRGGGGQEPRATAARERDIAQKIRFSRRLMRWLR